MNRGGAGGAKAGSGPLAARTCEAHGASGDAMGVGDAATGAASVASAPAWATLAPAGVGLSIMLEASLDPAAARAAASAEVRRRSSCSRSQRSSVALKGRGARSVRTRPVLTVRSLRLSSGAWARRARHLVSFHPIRTEQKSPRRKHRGGRFVQNGWSRAGLSRWPPWPTNLSVRQPRSSPRRASTGNHRRVGKKRVARRIFQKSDSCT